MRDLVIGVLVWAAVVGALLSVPATPRLQVQPSFRGATKPDAAQELHMIQDWGRRATLLY